MASRPCSKSRRADHYPLLQEVRECGTWEAWPDCRDDRLSQPLFVVEKISYTGSQRCHQNPLLPSEGPCRK
ncbi:hypothetical protein CN212_34035 [Sinorhizobium meliloti]|nr:hypothetical protein CN220_14935 [Sinorhizobium meliloti]RVH39012.1 hypothetical protein CN212_34035 [Sinorhizobium meliloti]